MIDGLHYLPPEVAMPDPSNDAFHLAMLIEQARSAHTLPSSLNGLVQQLTSGLLNRKATLEFYRTHRTFAARTLQIANSPVFCEGKPFERIEDAVDRLGANSLGWLALTVCLPGSLLKDIDEDVLERFWRHTICKALAARALTLHTRQRFPDQAFACAVLQHIGILVLIQQLGPPYLDFLRQVWREKSDLSHLENASLGFNHQTISATLLESWGLAPNVFLAVKHSSNPIGIDPPDEPTAGLAKRLYLADQLARVMDDRDELSLSRLSETGRQFFKLSLETLSSLLNKLDDEVETLSNVFQFDWQEETDLSKLVQQAEPQIEFSNNLQEHIPFRTSADALAEMDSVSPLLAACEGENLERSIPYEATKHNTEGENRWVPGANSSPITTNSKFLTLLKNTINRCRQIRGSMALACVEIDKVEVIQARIEPAEFESMIQSLSEQHVRFRYAADLIWQIGPSRWAIVMEDIDRSDAIRECRARIESIRLWARNRTQQDLGAATVSFGVAWLPVATLNFDATILLERAERCLSGAQLSGGDTIKSISI